MSLAIQSARSSCSAISGVVKSGDISFVEKTNIKLLVSPGGRFQFNFFAQCVPIIGTLLQHRAQHVHFVGQEQVRAFLQFLDQHEIKTGGGDDDQTPSRERHTKPSDRKARVPHKRDAWLTLCRSFQDIAGAPNGMD